MPWFGIVLYLHLLAVAAAFFFAAYVHWSLERVWEVRTTADALAALRLTARASTGLLWTSLALIATGAWLTQTAFAWTTPWIDLSLLGLIALAALAAIARARCQRPSAARDPYLRAANALLPLLTLSIVLIMILKPATLASAIILITSAGAGVVLSRRHRTTGNRVRTPGPCPRPLADPAEIQSPYMVIVSAAIRVAAAWRSPERQRPDPAGNRSPHSKRPTGATRAKCGEPPPPPRPPTSY